MNRRISRVDLAKLTPYIAKRAWLVFLCALLGFFGCYALSVFRHEATYTAAGTLLVTDGNPTIAEHQFAGLSDMNAAALLADTYRAVLKSDRVMAAAAARLQDPALTAETIADSLTLTALTDTGLLRVACTAGDGQTAAAICTAVLETAPEELMQAVGVGAVRVIDRAAIPGEPDAFSPWRAAVNGALIGALAAAALLTALFLLDRRVRSEGELAARYTPPVLGRVTSCGKESTLLRAGSPAELLDGYARLRLGLQHALRAGTAPRAAVIAGADGGVDDAAARLAVSSALSGARTLLIDGDLRTGGQGRFFACEQTAPGLADVLSGTCAWRDALVATDHAALQFLPAGQRAENPLALLSGGKIRKLLDKLSAEFDLILASAPPVGRYADALALSGCAGLVLTVRLNETDHRALCRTLTDAERTGMEVLGFAVFGDRPPRRN